MKLLIFPFPPKKTSGCQEQVCPPIFWGSFPCLNGWWGSRFTIQALSEMAHGQMTCMGVCVGRPKPRVSSDPRVWLATLGSVATRMYPGDLGRADPRGSVEGRADPEKTRLGANSCGLAQSRSPGYTSFCQHHVFGEKFFPPGSLTMRLC